MKNIVIRDPPNNSNECLPEIHSSNESNRIIACYISSFVYSITIVNSTTNGCPKTICFKWNGEFENDIYTNNLKVGRRLSAKSNIENYIIN